jgi:hypothetical protein
MAEQRLTMIFWRDDKVGRAYLRYSWVPTGDPHEIKLPPGLDEDSCSDSISPPIHIPQLQVYELYSDSLSTDNWYLPQAPSRATSIIHAAIEVFALRKEVVGTLHYADGSTWSDTRPLK